MADDAGALLVRSGLVSSQALDDARARVAGVGGTLGEQLVTGGAITDDALTDFYRSRLLVPQVNPNLLARLTPKVVATIPSDMAIELRAIPVSLDGDNNLTVAMSDPSDRHAVDEIAFFTGAYVVRAVATQLQIAWCLAHYYGHVTALGQRLLHTSASDSPIKAAVAASQRLPRAKGLTGKVNAARHRAIAPITGPVDVVRPQSGELDLRPLAAGLAPVAAPPVAMPPAPPAPALDLPSPVRQVPGDPQALPAPRSTPVGFASAATRATPATTPAVQPPAPVTPVGLVPRATPDAPTLPPLDAEPALRAASPPMLEPPATNDGAPDRPRARSVSGEIRVPSRRAASIRPPMPEPDDDDDVHDDDGDEPLIVIEPSVVDDDDTGPRMPAPPRRRAVKSDPPELYARAGEVDLKHSGERTIDADEPRIVVDEDALSTPTSLLARRLPDDVEPASHTIEVLDDADTGALIHDRVVDDASAPILLERPRATPDPDRARTSAVAPTAVAGPADGAVADDDSDTGEINIVVLDARKKPRPERRTQVGIPPAPSNLRPHRDTEATGVPTMVTHVETERSPDLSADAADDATTLDIRPAPASDDTGSDELAVPPGPSSSDDTNPYLVAAPPAPATVRTSALRRAVLLEDAESDASSADDDDDDEPHGPHTSVMTAVELDEAVPERAASPEPAHLGRRGIEHDPVDDGWGPPGTTIPPPLLGAIPGSEDDEAPSRIPMASIDSAPLVVEPPSLPSAGDSTGRALVRALEDATARAIEVIRQLEHAETRDQVVDIMVAHLAETHHRAGFFVTRHASSKSSSELGLFSMLPRPPVTPFATLRLDRPSTLQDVVGTRLPYRGPMHDDASRSFLVAVLGACPSEILLVPVAVRERVVGVLFGEHRQRHTFDDQLALAARAAGMALERILKTKRT